MKYEEIKALLDKGFTADYIMKMEDAEETAPDPEEKPEDKPEDKPEEKQSETVTLEMLSNVVETFTTKMDNVVKELQAANIMTSMQQGNNKNDMTAEDMLAQVILPPGVNNKEV